MDPLWKGRYMRQSSREAKESQNSSAQPVQHPAGDSGDKKEIGGRRYSGTGLPSIEGANSSQVSNAITYKGLPLLRFAMILNFKTFLKKLGILGVGPSYILD